jgi:hypothetical protein
MKKVGHLLLFIFIIVFTAECKRKEGYNCVDGECKAEKKDAQYLTLEDCKSDCENKPGKVLIHVSWPYTTCWYQIEVGIGHSSDDVTNEAYIDSKEAFLGSTGTFTYNKDGLAPGTYYYKVVRWSPSNYGPCGYSAPSTKIAPFVINPGKETAIEVTY